MFYYLSSFYSLSKGSSLCSAHLVFYCLLSWRTSLTDLQRPAAHTGGARWFGDLDRQGSDPHQRDAAGNAARLLQVPPAEHQTARRLRAAPLVSSSL